MRGCCCPIIPYQEIIGNYSLYSVPGNNAVIIPYQEIIGNYSGINVFRDDAGLYHTKK